MMAPAGGTAAGVSETGAAPEGGDLLRQLAADSAELVRRELDLARRELADSARRSATGAALLGGAGLCAGLAVHAGTVGALRALERVLPEPLAGAALGGAYATAAGALAAAGLSRLRADGSLIPERTVRTVEEDLQWARNPRTSNATSPPPESG